MVDLGARLDSAVAKAEAGLKASILTASEEVQKNIKIASDELHTHRGLTKDEVKTLVDYACTKFDETIEKRVAEIRSQTSALIDEKVSGLRKSLSEAAQEQKKAFVRNATIAVGSAMAVALLSIVSKRLSASPFDALAVFRIVLGMLAVGGAASLAFRLFRRYRKRSDEERNLIKVVVHDVGIIRPRGVGFHLVVLLVVTLLWLLLIVNPTVIGLR